jgi:hypothetical protein
LFQVVDLKPPRGQRGDLRRDVLTRLQQLDRPRPTTATPAPATTLPGKAGLTGLARLPRLTLALLARLPRSLPLNARLPRLSGSRS